MTNDELRALDKAATPGPWEVKDFPDPIHVGDTYRVVMAAGDLAVAEFTDRRDDAFIAAMRNELLRLLDDSDRLAKLREWWKTSADHPAEGMRALLAEMERMR